MCVLSSQPIDLQSEKCPGCVRPTALEIHLLTRSSRRKKLGRGFRPSYVYHYQGSSILRVCADRQRRSCIDLQVVFIEAILRSKISCARTTKIPGLVTQLTMAQQGRETCVDSGQKVAGCRCVSCTPSLSRSQLPGFACRHGRSRHGLVLLSVCSQPPCSVNAHQLRVVVSVRSFLWT